MKSVLFLLCLAGGLPLLAQPDTTREERQERVKRRQTENRRHMEEQIFNNRVEQEVQRRLNLEHQAAAQTAAVQAQQAANTYGGYGYNRWASQPIYHMPQDGAVAIGERVSLPNDILET